MGMTRVYNADELERALMTVEWSYITAGGGSASERVTLALVCPFCSSMVPPGVDSTGVDHKRHHVRYHVEQWRQIERSL